jgi:DNA-binding transcriptional regulator GbsR (MarR family)
MMRASEEQYRQFIEDMGELMEEHGLPHMAGRVIGSLLISPESYLSMDALVDELQASKGSISMSTQLLLRLGIIDRISLPGHRKRYYRIRENLWEELFLNRSDHIKRHVDLVTRGLELLRDEPIGRKRQLIEMQVFSDFLREELPGITERWAAQRTALLEKRLAEYA